MIESDSLRPGRCGALLLAAVAAVLTSWCGGAASTSAPATQAAAVPKAACWVLVDMDSFFCGPCLEHLLAFARAVPARVQDDRVRGILVFNPGRAPDDARRRAEVVRTKWQGFSLANGIRFPASIDADGAFAALAKAGVGVLVFDPAAGVVRRFPLPVPARALEEIVRILLD